MPKKIRVESSGRSNEERGLAKCLSKLLRTSE